MVLAALGQAVMVADTAVLAELMSAAELAGKARLRRSVSNGLLGLPTCWVPCDHVPVRSWPLFRARQLMRDVIESFQLESRL